MKKLKFDLDGDQKITKKDIELAKEIAEFEEKYGKTKMRRRLIYGGASLVAVVVIASLFLPASQVEVIAKMLDTIFKYIPFAG